MEWVRSLIRKAAALFSRGAPSPAENTAIPAEVPEREKETLIPETRQAETVSPSRHSGNELKSFETLQPGERRAPIAYSPDPLPTQDRKSRIAAVLGVTWVPDDSGNVILGRDDRFREQEREVQEVFTRYKGRYGTYVPGTMSLMSGRMMRRMKPKRSESRRSPQCQVITASRCHSISIGLCGPHSLRKTSMKLFPLARSSSKCASRRAFSPGFGVLI